MTANYTLTVVIPSALTATPANASVFVLTGYVGDVASLSVSGGVGAYTIASRRLCGERRRIVEIGFGAKQCCDPDGDGDD